ncbi:MAG: T9SS type A sorting domain-containing protein [Gemmatimonadota bacterium]|nr:MAG: T9SS type A sorting domain-containing protein [Gemmatimonadota bacterium]
MKKSMKTMVFHCILILLIYAPLTAGPDKDPFLNTTTVEMRVRAMSVSTGDTFSVEVTVGRLLPLKRVDMKISHDPKRLACLSMNPRGDHDHFRNTKTNIDSKGGTLVFAATAGSTGNVLDSGGGICTLNFLALQAGETELVWRRFGTASGKGSGPIAPFRVKATTLSISEKQELVTQAPLPDCFDLSQNYPNPFNPETHISYQIPVARHVRLTVFNILGQEIRTLVDKEQTPGYYTIFWDGRDSRDIEVSSGMYFYRMESGDFVHTRRMTLLR